MKNPKTRNCVPDGSVESRGELKYSERAERPTLST